MKKIRIRALAIKILGGWIVFDGAVSIIEYWGQSFPEQLIRIVRIIVGIAVILL